MAVSDPYAVVADYKLYVPKTSSSDDATVLEQLGAASRAIDGRLGRFFALDASAVAREFIRPVGTDPRVLVVPDIGVSPTGIKIDRNGDGDFDDSGDDTLVAADWRLWPRNAALGPEARPWTRIDLTVPGDYSVWPDDQLIEVTAQWGWPAVPDAIKNITIEIVAVLRLGSPRATREISELGVGRSITQIANTVLEQHGWPYRKTRF